jgi:hypothetical protein
LHRRPPPLSHSLSIALRCAMYVRCLA